MQSLLDADIIAPSTSSFASPIVLVRKKSGGLRMCVDYRRLNARTAMDSYAVPKIEDLFLTLSGARYFTSIDLSKAYYQVPLTERAERVSAFTTPFGLYKWLRMPMGLKNSAPCFQRLMETVFADMYLAELIVFLDDVLHGRTLEELEERTVAALERLRRFGLKLDPRKFIFGAERVRHLGFIISSEGVRPREDSGADDVAGTHHREGGEKLPGIRRFLPSFRSLLRSHSQATQQPNVRVRPSKVKEEGRQKGHFESVL